MSSRATSTSHTPSKRRRLDMPSSSSSKSTPIPRSMSSNTILDEEDYLAARRASAVRVLSVWETLEQRYTRAMDEDDIVDLRTGRLVQDKGVLKAMEKPKHYGHLLGEGEDDEDKDDGATTDGGEGFVTAGEDEEDEGGDDELGLTGEGDELEEHGASSEDELGAWDTVPAPPTEPPSPSEPAIPTPASDAPSAPNAVDFLYKNVRPRLEQLAREREESPLPAAEDLEAFLAAENSLQARPGYVEPEDPEDDDDDEPVFIGYGASFEGEDPATSEPELDEEEVDDSDDELNDWSTMPAPPDEEDEQEQDEPQDELQLREESEDEAEALSDHDNLPVVDTAPTDDEDDEVDEEPPEPPRVAPARSPSPVATSKSKPKNSTKRRPQLPTPPYSNATTSTGGPSRQSTASPSKRDRVEVVLEARPQQRPKSPSKPTAIPPSRVALPTKSKTAPDPFAGPSNSRPKPNLSRRQSEDTPSYRRTPSALIPEVVVPTVREITAAAASSPTKSPTKKATSRESSSAASPTKTKPAPRSPSKSRVETASKKRKRDSMEVIDDSEDETAVQVVDRLGSLDLEDHAQQVQELWQREPSLDRQRSPSPPVRSPISAVYDERDRHSGWQQPRYEEEEEEEEEYDTAPIPSSSSRDPGPRRAPPSRHQAQPQHQHQQQSNPFSSPYQPPFGQFYGNQQSHPMPAPQPYQQSFMGPPPTPTPPAPFANIVNMMPNPMIPMFQYPVQPQPAPGLGHEALLTQMLYSLNYLAYQNAHNTPAQNTPQAQSFEADQFASMSPQANYRTASTPVSAMPSRRHPQYAASDDYRDSPQRSILRVGGSRDRERALPMNHNNHHNGLGLVEDPGPSRRKGKERENVVLEYGSSSDFDQPRAASVTFSDPPTASTPKGRYAPPRRTSFVGAQAPPRPSPLRNVSSFVEDDFGHRPPDSNASSSDQWSSPSPIHRRSNTTQSFSTGQNRAGPSHSLSSHPSVPMFDTSSRSSDSTSSSTTSQAVLAKARAALSSSAATTASLGISRNDGPRTRR